MAESRVEAWDRLERENAELRRALEPFARLAVTPLRYANVRYGTDTDPERQTFQTPSMHRAFNRAAEVLRAAKDGVMASEPRWEYHWLVELFHRGDGAPSMGRYHTGFTDLQHQSRSTTQAHEARRYTKEQAQRVAGELNVHMMACEWRAVEHGFSVAHVTSGVLGTLNDQGEKR